MESKELCIADGVELDDFFDSLDLEAMMPLVNGVASDTSLLDEQGSDAISDVTCSSTNQSTEVAGHSAISHEDLEYLNELERKMVPQSTENQTKRYSKMFRDFLNSRKLDCDFETIPNNILCDNLRLFYETLRSKEGLFYSPKTLICIRAALQRYLSSVDVNRMVNIVSGVEFVRANNVVKAAIGMYLKSGQPTPKQYDAISDSDMQKLKRYFNRCSDTRLQEEIIFILMLHFGLRGREHLRLLKSDSLVLQKDDAGNEYYRIGKVLPSKNVKASVCAKVFEEVKKARLYRGADQDGCPFLAVQQYLQKIRGGTKDDCLFPKSLKNGGFSREAVLGKEYLGNIMAGLSKDAELSKRYTNHCVRVTTVTSLKKKGWFDLILL